MARGVRRCKRHQNEKRTRKPTALTKASRIPVTLLPTIASDELPPQSPFMTRPCMTQPRPTIFPSSLSLEKEFKICFPSKELQKTVRLSLLLPTAIAFPGAVRRLGLRLRVYTQATPSLSWQFGSWIATPAKARPKPCSCCWHAAAAPPGRSQPPAVSRGATSSFAMHHIKPTNPRFLSH